jgi:hypothetical protein
MQRPDPIAISAEHAEALRKLNALRVGNAAFVEQMRQAGERRNAELVSQGQQLWQELATAYGLDVQHVGYDLAQDGSNALIVVQAAFG